MPTSILITHVSIPTCLPPTHEISSIPPFQEDLSPDYFKKISIIYCVYVCLCLCIISVLGYACGGQRTIFLELVCSEDQIQLVRFGSELICMLNHLALPFYLILLRCYLTEPGWSLLIHLLPGSRDPPVSSFPVLDYRYVLLYHRCWVLNSDFHARTTGISN